MKEQNKKEALHIASTITPADEPFPSKTPEYRFVYGERYIKCMYPECHAMSLYIFCRKHRRFKNKIKPFLETLKQDPTKKTLLQEFGDPERMTYRERTIKYGGSDMNVKLPLKELQPSLGLQHAEEVPLKGVTIKTQIYEDIKEEKQKTEEKTTQGIVKESNISHEIDNKSDMKVALPLKDLQPYLGLECNEELSQ